MSPIGRLRAWWQGRDDRERRMLAVMVVMVAAFAYWYGLIVPLQRLRAAAREDHRQAVHEAQAMAVDLTRIAALRRAGTQSPPTESLPAAVLAAADDAGLAISRQRGNGDRFEVGIDSAGATQVFAWLDRLRKQHGVVPHSLDIERHNAGVRVQASFGASREKH